jgi:CDP-glucose 4,6-dehydratase
LDRLVTGSGLSGFRGQRVLVTGHTGFKGSWLSYWLLELGAEVAGFSLDLPSTPCNFEVLGLRDRVRDYRGDVRDLAAIKSVFDEFRPQTVFHLAAQAIVRTSYDDPKTTFDTNLGGTVNMLEVLRLAPEARTAVFITSDKCYENVEWEFGYRESDRLGGKDPYSASKACAEIAINSYARSFLLADGCRIASTRAGNVIGGGDWARDRIIPDCIRAWTSDEIPVIRSPQATRPWQHVLEPLSGYLWLAARLTAGDDGLAGEAFNFGPSANVNQPVSRLIDEMLLTWSDRAWQRDPDAAGVKPEAGLLKLCCDKALHRLGWRATLEFEETVAMTAAWYRSHNEGQADMKAFAKGQIQAFVQMARERSLPWAM